MTTIERLTKHPLTQQWEYAKWNAHHFAFGTCGVRFSDGSIYNPEVVRLKVRSEYGD